MSKRKEKMQADAHARFAEARRTEVDHHREPPGAIGVPSVHLEGGA